MFCWVSICGICTRVRQVTVISHVPMNSVHRIMMMPMTPTTITKTEYGQLMTAQTHWHLTSNEAITIPI